MKRLHIALSLAALILAAPAVTGNPLAAVEGPAENWIVGLHSTPTQKVGDTFLNAEVLAVDTDLNYVLVSTTNVAVLRALAVGNADIRYIETDVSDHKLHLTPNDYYWTHASNWGVQKIGAMTAWDKTLGTTSVKDGHLDSGIFRTHEDFTPSSRFLAGKNYYQTSKTHTNDESGCSWHGSHTIGTVAATINNAKGFPGLAQITVIPVKIFGGGFCFAASTTNLANAIKYVGDQGAQLSSNSWGGGSYSTTINDAITYSVNKGVIFVASSGNGQCSNCVGNPWKPQSANVIIVSATDSNDAGATFNSKGPEVDISAPGVYIGSAGGPNANSYYIMDGTSMAAPHVTGVAALIKTLNPSFTRAQVESRLTSTAVDLGPAGKDDTFGYGRLNAAAAVY